MTRTAEHAVDALFLERFSPRSFTDAAIADADLFSMLEAARWAPSASNLQPWRFVYGKRGTPAFEGLHAALVPGNQRWAGRAAALVACGAVTEMMVDGVAKPIGTHAFDTGAAWMSFALQAAKLGFATHAMAGFSAEVARERLRVPADVKIFAIVAVGRRGPAEVLEEDLRAREVPSGRKSLAETAFEGAFPAA